MEVRLFKFAEKGFFFGLEFNDRLKSYKISTYGAFFGFIFGNSAECAWADLLNHVQTLKRQPDLALPKRFGFPSKALIQELNMSIADLFVQIKTENHSVFGIAVSKFVIRNEEIFSTELKTFDMKVDKVVISFGISAATRKELPERFLFDVFDFKVREIKQRGEKQVRVSIGSVKTITLLNEMQEAMERVFNYIGFFFRFMLTSVTTIVGNSLFGKKTPTPAEILRLQFFNNANLDMNFQNCDLKIELNKNFSLKILVDSAIKAPFENLKPEFTAIDFLNTQVLTIEDEKEFVLFSTDKFQILKQYVLLYSDDHKFKGKEISHSQLQAITGFYIRNKFLVSNMELKLPYIFKPVISAVIEIANFSSHLAKNLSESMQRPSIQTFILDSRAENVVKAKSISISLKHMPINVCSKAMSPQSQ